MRSRLVYLSVTLAAFAVNADAVITDMPDGVNVRTRVVNTDGYVVGESTTTAYVPQKVYITDAFLGLPRVGVANDDFIYVLLTPYEWVSLTNRIAILEATASRRLSEDYKTAAGRRMWHGKEVTRVVNPDGLSVTWHYPDGFEYTEREERANAVKRTRPQTARNPAPAAPAKPTRPSLPPRLAAKREAVKSRAGRVQEVNAVFGPGGKVLKVEEKGESK